MSGGGEEEGDVRSLLLATYEADEVVYRGKVGTGFTDKMRKALQLEPLAMPEPALKVQRDAAKLARWVKPVLVAEGALSEVTPDGSLRHPSFQGLREDKSAAEVTLELP